MKKYLPITSFFNKQSSPENNNIFFRFNLKYEKNTDLIYLEKYKNNPSLCYRHKWLTCFEPEKHLDELIEKLIKGYIKKNNLNIFGYSFKDDSSINRLNFFFNKNKNTHNIKTSREIGLAVNGACLEKLFKFTTSLNLKKVSYSKGKADILFVRHVLEHTWDIKKFLEGLKLLISKNGLVIFEVPDCEKALRNGMQTLLWEEHASYFTEESLSSVLNNNGFKIVEKNRYPNQIEDSLVFITKLEKPKKIQNSSKKGKLLLDIFTKNFVKKKLVIKNKIEDLISSGFKIYIFGAGHHASSFVSMNELNNKISYVIDDNINKQKYFLAGSSIPIMPSEFLKKETNNINLFLTTNPENHKKITTYIESLNNNITIYSIFNFY